MKKVLKKENAVNIYNYLKEHDGENFTAADIAEALNINVKSVNGTLNFTFMNNKDENKVVVPMIERVENTVELEDGKTKVIKFVRLTEAGRNAEIEVDIQG
jgi:ABC-type transport system substrate-binding protein